MVIHPRDYVRERHQGYVRESHQGKWQGVGEGVVDRRERGEQSRFRPSQWTLGLSGPSELAGRRRHPILESWIRDEALLYYRCSREQGTECDGAARACRYPSLAQLDGTIGTVGVITQRRLHQSNR